MTSYFDRLYHCHKVDKSIRIMEDYELIDGKKILIRCQCPIYNDTEKGIKCNGFNDHGLKCGYADYIFDAKRIKQ